MIRTIAIALFLIFLIWVLYRCYTFEVDFEELETTTKTCPRCNELLFLDVDDFVRVYRCKNCKFEGAKVNLPKRIINKIPNYEH